MTATIKPNGTAPGLAGGSQPSHVGSNEMLVERALARLR